MDSATKRPWQWHKIADAPVYGIYGNTTLKYVASVLHEEEAKLIVKAVNLHDELIEIIKELIEEAEYGAECYGMSDDEQEIVDGINEKINRAKKVLKKAEAL